MGVERAVRDACVRCALAPDRQLVTANAMAHTHSSISLSFYSSVGKGRVLCQIKKLPSFLSQCNYLADSQLMTKAAFKPLASVSKIVFSLLPQHSVGTTPTHGVVFCYRCPDKERTTYEAFLPQQPEWHAIQYVMRFLSRTQRPCRDRSHHCVCGARLHSSECGHLSSQLPQ